MPASGAPQAPSTPPAMVNGVPYKPGSWDVHEDELLAHWQKEFGNRYPLLGAVAVLPCRRARHCEASS